MRGRRNRQAPVSLFAFQDVMAAVIGILFFIVLIMALDLVTEPTAADSDIVVPEESRLEDLRAELERRESEKRKLEREVNNLAARMRFITTTDPQDAVDEVKGIHDRLEQRYARIISRQKEHQELEQKVQEVRRNLDDMESELEKLGREERELEELADSQEVRPRVTYIIGEEGGKIPWLVKVDGRRIQVGAQDGQSTSLTFDAQPFEKRKEHFLSWVGTQNRRTHYFVLLIKPSGVKHYPDLGRAITGADFDIGVDLLPERWVAFD